MTRYRAIVSVTFDDEDVARFARATGVDVGEVDHSDLLEWELDVFTFAYGRLEQLFRDGTCTIPPSPGHINVAVRDHERQ